MSPRKPVAAVLGLDGFDLDVAFNLGDLYRSLGYQTVYVRTPVKCDLLVVHRPINADFLAGFEGSVHVFDYVGRDLSQFINALPRGMDIYFYFSSERRRQELAVGRHTWLLERSEVLYPPVSVRLWTKPLRGIKNDYVHVGNFKPSYTDEGDALTQAVLDDWAKANISIFGQGWTKGNRSMDLSGPVRLGQVSDVYRRSRISLGLMYPFQRGVTMSGRFWHAPLNGALLLSEAPVPEMNPPGLLVRGLDYESIWDLDGHDHVRSELQKRAYNYWDDRFKYARGRVGGRLCTASVQGTGVQVQAPVRKVLRDRAWRFWHLRGYSLSPNLRSFQATLGQTD